MDALQLEKWRVQADHVAANLKAITEWGNEAKVTAGVILGDHILKATLEVALIQRLNTQALGDAILEAWLKANDSQPAPAGPTQEAGDGSSK